MSTQPAADEYEISTDTQRLDVGMIHRFLSEESYWSLGISRATVERAIQHSLCFGAYCQNEQVGFARVVTDRTTFALLADVFVLKDHRGKGLSKRLMQHVVEHEDLQGLRRLLLLTSDAHGLYKQYGFKELANPARFMEIFRPDIYRSS
ncbi:GNAT family N-acetyltransferase [Paraburkholderia acidicola]|uniref:GNAT family N-acetyltransferase n=1 Tax=Paraburkholderia acidicola TaxID=1912599 RepID=A0A2A4EZG6_9BURK|nr:GNAT family N-acetyltransferase [Paraburkholderia acidicola]PCE27013.1 GNAT family N-acetyltransferase [Paraburkholderia acidicola]